MIACNVFKILSGVKSVSRQYELDHYCAGINCHFRKLDPYSGGFGSLSAIYCSGPVVKMDAWPNCAPHSRLQTRACF